MPSGAAPTFDPGLAGLIPEMRWRGQFHAASEGLEARLGTNREITAYIGFDPSGPWLHVGHLVPIFGLIRLQQHGGRPIARVSRGIRSLVTARWRGRRGVTVMPL